MSEMSTSARIEVVSPGNRLTVQDLGRRGSQRYGVSVSGVLDLQAAVIANRLVGNPATTALLEATFGGVSIRFEQQTKVAITGAEVAVDIDRFPIPIWETVIVPAGTELSVSIPTDGLYTYIAIEDGIDVPRVLGSRSTHVASGLGGIGGRALKEGDILPLGKEQEGPERPRAGTTAPADLVPACVENARRIRVIKGPQYDVFDNDAILTFLRSTFTVSNLTDRQGARLDGSAVRAIGGKHDIVSDPAYMGAVQVPADGKPIVLLADRQPTGGYAKIASVISPDLPAVVQKPPGSEIGFELVEVEKAQEYASRFRRSIYEEVLREPERVFVSNFAVDGETYNVELVHPRNADDQGFDDGIVYAAIDGGSEMVATYECLESAPE